MRPLLLLAVALLATAPAHAGHGKKDKHDKHDKHHAPGAHAHDWPDHHGIPEGHMPPPGSCRVWFPGEPPGHQPPPTSCRAAFRDAPRGAWVLERPYDHPEVLWAHVVRPRRTTDRAHRLAYDVHGGVFLHVEWR